MRGTGKAYRTHVHHSSTPYPGPWSFRVRRWLIKQPGEQSCCCSLIYKVTHFKDGRRIRPLFLPPHPRRNRNTPARRRVHIADQSLRGKAICAAFSHLYGAICVYRYPCGCEAAGEWLQDLLEKHNHDVRLCFCIIISDLIRIIMTKL